MECLVLNYYLYIANTDIEDTFYLNRQKIFLTSYPNVCKLMINNVFVAHCILYHCVRMEEYVFV